MFTAAANYNKKSLRKTGEKQLIKFLRPSKLSCTCAVWLLRGAHGYAGGVCICRAQGMMGLRPDRRGGQPLCRCANKVYCF